MNSLRNKKTGRFLTLDVNTEIDYEYGYDESIQVTHAYIELSDSEFPGIIFTTDHEDVIEKLLKIGQCLHPDIRINFGKRKTKFKLSDLEVVPLSVTPSI